MALLTPWFLAGALAVGLPLWLHLLQRENPVRLRISSLMFFEKQTQSTIRERRFRHLLLLALRLALLLLLALAFAKPIWERPPAAVAGDIPSLHIIALDTSLSMQHSDRRQRAQAAANAVIASLDEGDRAQIIAHGPSVSVVTEAVDDRSELRRAVASLQPTAARNSFGDVIEAVRSLASNADYPVELHLISDCQNTAMPGRFNDLVLPAAAALQIHNVADGAAPNWAIESVKGARRLFGVESPRLEVTVGGYAAPKTDKRVVLMIDGKRVAAAAGEIPENGRASFTFDDFDPPRGFSRAEFVLEPADDLPADDRRLAALDNAEPDPVLFVSADSRKRGLLHYRTALGASTGVRFALEAASPGEAERLDPDRYALIVLSDIPQLSSAFLTRLRNYAASGGSLFLALGPQTANAGKVVLTGHEVDQPLFSERGATRFQSAGRSDPSHPITEKLKRLSGVKFFLYARVKTEETDDVPLRLGNGDPLLIEHTLGAGRVLLFASTIDNVWNDLPISPLFVPFVVETAGYLTGMEGAQNQALVNSVLELSRRRSSGGMVQVFDPQGARALTLSEAVAREDLILDQVGFYEVRRGERSELLAVNPDPLESNLRPLDEDTLELWKSTGRSGPASAPAAEDGESPVQTPPLKIWKFILLLMVAAALLESIVGNRHLNVAREV